MRLTFIFLITASLSSYALADSKRYFELSKDKKIRLMEVEDFAGEKGGNTDTFESKIDDTRIFSCKYLLHDMAQRDTEMQPVCSISRELLDSGEYIPEELMKNYFVCCDTQI